MRLACSEINVKLGVSEALSCLTMVSNILCVTYFVTSLTMPDPQSSYMHHIR